MNMMYEQAPIYSHAPKLPPQWGLRCLHYSFALCASLFVVALLHTGASAETEDDKKPSQKDSAQSRIGFLHTPPKPESLPYPGQPMTISAGLTHTRETKFPMRIVLSRDGRFMELPSKEAYLDKYDRPIYEVSLPAPIAEVTYQMFVVAGEDQVMASPRYTVRRNCIPQIALATGEVPAQVQGTERLQKLIQESRALENDLKGYEFSLELLEELIKVIG